MPKGTPFYGITLDALWHNIIIFLKNINFMVLYEHIYSKITLKSSNYDRSFVTCGVLVSNTFKLCVSLELRSFFCLCNWWKQLNLNLSVLASDVYHLVFDQTLFPHQLTLVEVMQWFPLIIRFIKHDHLMFPNLKEGIHLFTTSVPFVEVQV